MIEMATILHGATERSLVLVDEIGRGTSTYDGLALAWACASSMLTDVQAMCMFSTHYFEITALAETSTGAKNVHLDAVQHKGNIVFLYEVKDGATSRSYGIQVARLAGIPSHVISLASKKLTELTENTTPAQLEICEGLFQSTIFDPSPSQKPSPALDRLSEIEPDNLAPREALEVLYQLKAIHEKN